MATFTAATAFSADNVLEINPTSQSGSSSLHTFFGPGGDKIVVSGTGIGFEVDGSNVYPSFVNGNSYTIKMHDAGVLQWTVSGMIADETKDPYGDGYYVGENLGEIFGMNAEFAFWLRYNDTINGSASADLLRGYYGNDTVNGNGGNDTVAGNAGNDILNGNAGNDNLVGGGGKDALTGGAGKDAFVFKTTLNASTNVDTIKDFVAVDDTIKLENAVFKKLTATGLLAAASFKADTSGNASDGNDYILYETDTGKLFYDLDGNGAGAKVLFAVLGTSTHPAITAADFVVI